MKKIILPLVTVAFLAACSDSNDDANFVAPSGQTGVVSSSSVAVVPPTSSEVVPPASSAAVVPPSGDVSSSSAATVPLSSAAGTPTDPQFTYSVPTLTELNPGLSYTFYGAELTGVEQFKYGRFEARMKMASISGSVSSMFLNYDNSWMKEYEPWNEIDIEILGKDPSKWQSNIITREGDPSIKKNTSSEVIHPFAFDATKEFHLYAIIWTPEYVAWEIDSVEVRRDTLGMSRGKHADGDQVKFMTEEQTLRFNLWASKTPSWTGKFTGEGLPVEQHIDYVRVYAYDVGTKAFTLSWQDDFEGDWFDTKRWSAGNWEMENVKYRDLNIRVENGFVKLRLDYELKQ